MTSGGKKDFRKEALADTAPLETDDSSRSLLRGERSGTNRLSGARLIQLDRLTLDHQRLRQSMNEAALQKLAESIKTHGVIHPITVEFEENNDVYRIITGARRFIAARRAGLKELPCIIREPSVDSFRIQQLIENIHREDLPILAEAEAIKELCNVYKLSQREVARRIGRPKTYVNELLRILELPPDIKEQLSVDPPIPKISLLKLSRLNDPHKARDLFRKLQQDHLSAKQLEQQKEYPNSRRGGRLRHYEFYYRSGDKRFLLKLKFNKISVTTAEIMQALQEALNDLREGLS